MQDAHWAKFLGMVSVVLGITAFGSTRNFTFGTNGLLASRSNPWRTFTIGQRDGRGRVLFQTNVVAGANALIENLTWRTNSTIGSYAATRTGSGAWNDSRAFGYNTRGQVTNEPVTLATSSNATNLYSFDAAKLGVLTGVQLSGASTNNWQAIALSPFSQIATESWNQASIGLRAGGSAISASSVSAFLDGSSVGSVLGSGRWCADLSLSPGSHTLAATASYSVGNYSASATNSFSVVGNNSVTNLYDSAGNVTNRAFANGKTQALVWDSSGQLVSLIQRENITNGFNWTAVYDAMGRRLRTIQVPIVNGATNSVMTLTLDSLYDPQVEFGEVGVAVNGQRTWKIVGPDVDGHFGSMEGIGGLEATYRESDGSIVPVLNDYFGNVPATVSGATVNWSSTRLTGYGPEIGYELPALNSGTLLADTLIWRSRRTDPSGLYCLGVRYYEPLGGRFLSADPLGHSASWDLYSFCNGDALNRFDPSGRFGKNVSDSLQRASGELSGSFGDFRGGSVDFGFAGFGRGDRALEDLEYNLSPAGQFMLAYQQTEADIFQTRYAGYLEPWEGNSHTAAEVRERFLIGFANVVTLGLANDATSVGTGIYNRWKNGRSWGYDMYGDITTPREQLVSGVMAAASFVPVDRLAVAGSRLAVRLGEGAAEFTPRAYSVAFQMQLDVTQLGLRDVQHFQIANQALEAERAVNPALAELVPPPQSSTRPPADWTWQHATIEQGGGQAGIMQLVPRWQHTPGSPFWPLLHPLPNGAGGYAQWAVPAGARPRN